MKGVRFTKAEVAFLRQCMTTHCSPWGDMSAATQRLNESVARKLDAAETAPTGVAVKPIEDALIRTSHGKVLALEGGHARASRVLTALGATVEQAELIGAYMARSTWLTSPMTVFDVAAKWNSWLPKARATQPPPSLKPGLDGLLPCEKVSFDSKPKRTPGFR